MTIKEALYTYLSTYGGITAISGDRVYPRWVRAGDILPMVTINLFANAPFGHTGVSDGTLERPQFRITCWGDDDDPDLLAYQVKTALRDYCGTMGGDGGVTVLRVLFEGEQDVFDIDMERAGVELDFEIHHYTV